ncbi:MAG: choice-of-anchor J domain-containing protein [candidate division WOR-3 bacterium]
MNFKEIHGKYFYFLFILILIYPCKIEAQWVYLLNEDFETTPPDTIPEGWTVIDGNNDGQKWKVKDTILNHVACYQHNIPTWSYNEELWTPKIAISEIDSLRFKYSYYFYMETTGQKYRVHFRKKIGNSWSSWIQLKVYTANSFGIDSFDLTNYLPCDSIQFRFFYSDSTTSYPPWTANCQCDNVILKGKSLNIKEKIKLKILNKLTIFDINGRKVGNLVNEKICAGIYFILTNKNEKGFFKIVKLK